MAVCRVILAVAKRIERIRLYPTTRQAAALAVMLDVMRELYNALVQQRRDAYRLRKVTVTGRCSMRRSPHREPKTDACERCIARPKMPCCIAWT
jgi:hypothetical protein